MEKSIENIWKQGFLNENALVAPKINDLYNQKSKDIVTRFKRAFKINIIALFVFSFLALFLSIYYNMLVLGIIIFITFNAFALYSLKINKDFKQLNQNVNSYEYLKSFDVLLKKHIDANKKLARLVYPIIITPFLFVGYKQGFAMGSKNLGQNAWETFQSLFTSTEGILFFSGSMLIFVVIIALITFFSDKLYQWDLNLTYGKMFKKLEQTLADMEDLRAEQKSNPIN